MAEMAPAAMACSSPGCAIIMPRRAARAAGCSASTSPGAVATSCSTPPAAMRAARQGTSLPSSIMAARQLPRTASSFSFSPCPSLSSSAIAESDSSRCAFPFGSRASRAKARVVSSRTW